MQNDDVLSLPCANFLIFILHEFYIRTPSQAPGPQMNVAYQEFHRWQHLRLSWTSPGENTRVLPYPVKIGKLGPITGCEEWPKPIPNWPGHSLELDMQSMGFSSRTLDCIFHGRLFCDSLYLCFTVQFVSNCAMLPSTCECDLKGKEGDQ